MKVEFMSKENDYMNETTRYWFEVDGEEFCVADQNGNLTILDYEGYPIEDDPNTVNLLIHEYEKHIMDF